MSDDARLQADVRRYYETVAHFMDAELLDRGDEELWRRIGGEHAGGSILEIGCGSGRVTELLASAGATVVGIDLSPELLRLARERLARRGNVRLLIEDMRALALRCRFDAIVAPDDPFSHLTSDEDRDRALACVAAHLTPGGVFVLDALWFPAGARHGHVRTRDVELDGRR